MTVRIVSQYTLYRHKRFFSAFPSLAMMKSGQVALAFRRAPDHRWLLGDIAEEDFNSVDHVHFRSHVAFGVLDEQLRLAAEPTIMPVHAEAADQDGNLFVSKSGRLFQYSFRWYPVTKEIVEKLAETGFKTYGGDYLGAGFIFHSAYIRFSDDEGANWSNPFEIPIDPMASPRRFPEAEGTTSIRGRMVELDSGELLLPVYSGCIKDVPRDCVRFLRSVDGGDTWDFQDTHLFHDTWALQEPTLAKWPAGNITVFNRTRHNEDKLVTATSDADGASFGALKSVDVVGHPYDAVPLPDGRLFLVYGYRHEPMGVRARIVEEGQDIGDAEEIIIREDSLSRDTGYPSTTLLSDGRLLVAYYIPDKQGIRGIEASIIEFD
jgi:hypothetical protein